MDIKEINKLLNSFYEGQTSQEEERVLYKFFSEENIPEEMISEKKIFLKLYSGQRSDVPLHLEEKLNFLIDNLEKEDCNRQKPSIGLRRIRMGKPSKWAMSIAASILLLITGGIFTYWEYTNKTPMLVDTYSNPEDAYIETQKTLLLVSNKLNKGIKQVEKVNDIIR